MRRVGMYFVTRMGLRRGTRLRTSEGSQQAQLRLNLGVVGLKNVACLIYSFFKHGNNLMDFKVVRCAQDWTYPRYYNDACAGPQTLPSRRKWLLRTGALRTYVADSSVSKLYAVKVIF